MLLDQDCHDAAPTHPSLIDLEFSDEETDGTDGKDGVDTTIDCSSCLTNNEDESGMLHKRNYVQVCAFCM